MYTLYICVSSNEESIDIVNIDDIFLKLVINGNLFHKW